MAKTQTGYQVGAARFKSEENAKAAVEMRAKFAATMQAAAVEGTQDVAFAAFFAKRDA